MITDHPHALSSHVFRFYGIRSVEGKWSFASPEENQHVRKVLRLAVGSGFELGDGKGWVASCELLNQDFKLVNESYAARPNSQLSIVQALLNPADLSDVVTTVSEAGADRLIWFTPKLDSKIRLPSDAQRQRLIRIAVAAMKQSKRRWLLEIEFTSSIDAAFKTFAKDDAVVVLSAEYPQKLNMVLQGVSPEVNTNFIIGNEAGFSRDDSSYLAKQIQRGCLGANLGRFIYRAVHAPMVATACYENLLRV